MLNKFVSASLVAMFSLVSLDGGIATFDSKDYTFEIAYQVDFGIYDRDYKNNDFTVPFRIGNAYQSMAFRCYAMIYYPDDRFEGGFDCYPDLDEMGDNILLTTGFMVNETTHVFEATFHTTFFGNYNKDNDDFDDIILVLHLDGTSMTGSHYSSDKSYSFSFASRTVMQGHGEYTIEPGTTEFYPYDERIVFGGDRPNWNVTETLDFSNTREALCEEKYLDIRDDFKISYTAYDPNDNNTWGSPNSMVASIWVCDPEYLFPDMHTGSNPNFELPLEYYDKTLNHDYSKQITASFRVGGKTYWVNPNTLEMSLYEKPRYNETEIFYFRAGYFDQIRENCEFYLRAEHVGHNEATYNLKLDFLGDHNYFGSCVESDYCMHYGKG